MKKILAILALLYAAPLFGAGPQPCYFSGQYVKCFPPLGLQLNGSTQGLILGSTTDATSGSTGSINTPGGIGAAKQIWSDTLVIGKNGMKFKDTGAGSTTISWYEEGTFTPTLVGSGSSFTTVTYGLQSGKFTRIGRLLFWTIDLRWSNTTGTASGTLSVGAFPYSCTAYHNSAGFEGGSIDLPTGAVDCYLQNPTSGGTTFGALCTRDATSTVPVDIAVNGGAGSRSIIASGFCQL